MAALLILAVESKAAAIDPLRDYAIPESSLADALAAWADISKSQILYAPELVAGRRVGPLVGRYAGGDALRLVLQGSGVVAEASGSAIWVLKKAPSARVPRQEPAPVAPSPPDTPPTQVMDTVSVYSRPLMRIASESSMPVLTLTRRDIEASTHLTLFDLLRSLPGVQVTSLPVQGGRQGETFGTSATGASSVALRNLGSKATLMLIDGRRMTNYGLAADATGGVPDVDTIPLAMVERIDILRDGASTLYGADAIGGVIDISLRKDLSMQEVGALLGTSSRGDATHRHVTATLAGPLIGHVSGLVMVDVVDHDPLLGDRRAWHSQDRRRDGLSDARSVFSFPGNRVVESGNQMALVSRPGCRIEDLDDENVCRDDRAKSTSLEAGRRSGSVRGYLRAPLGASADAYADVRMTRTQHTQQSPPVTASILLPDDDERGSSVVQHAFWDVGAVRQSTDAALVRLDTGITGMHHDWTWSAGVDAEQSRVHDRIQGLVNRFGFLEVAALGYRFDARPAPQGIIDILAPSVTNRGVSQSVAVRAAGSREFDTWTSLPGNLHLGFDAGRDRVRLHPDAALVSGDLIAIEASAPFSAARSSAAAYARADLPLAASLALDGGLRVEWVGREGGAVAPALGVRWKPTEALLLRAGAARGRRVPTLLEQRTLASAGLPSTYAYFDVPQELAPCAQFLGHSGIRCLLELRPSDGPALKPEHSRNQHAGLIWEPRVGLSAGIDVYEARRSREIGMVPPDYVLQNAHLFPGVLVRDADGRLDALRTFRTNLGDTLTRGVDADFRWDVMTRPQGVLTLAVSANHVFDLQARLPPSGEPVERAGFGGFPTWSATTSLRWTGERASIALSARSTGGYRNASFDGDAVGCTTVEAVRQKCRTPSFTLVNLHMAYSGIAQWRLTLGLSNLLDHRPRHFQEGSTGYNPLIDDPVGRYVAMGATRQF